MIVFVAGSREINHLDSSVLEKLSNIINQNTTVLVGDANGVDRLVQHFFSDRGYRNVEVFACEGKARNNFGGWAVKAVPVGKKAKGFEYYKIKDREMALVADCGFMIWDGKSRGTLNNVLNLVGQGKKAFVYFAPQHVYYQVDKLEGIDEFAKLGGEQAYAQYRHLCSLSQATQQFSFAAKKQ